MSSVKDRVALWESKATGGSNPVPQANPKAINTNNFNSKPEQPKNNINQSNPQYHVQETTILKPSELKKKESLGSNALFNNAPTKPIADVKPINQTSKPENNSLNNPKSIAQNVQKNIAEPAKNANIEIQVPIISKPSDMKKKLQESGRGTYFTPPVQIKKIEQPHTQHNEHYEVETTNISVNVKQNAKKLDKFYSHKQENEPHKIEQAHHQQPTHDHQQAHTQHASKHMTQSEGHGHHPQQQANVHHQTSNTMNIETNYEDSFAMLQHHPNDKPNQEEKPQGTVQTQKMGDSSMVLRLQNRKKQNKKAFESDSD